MRRVHAEPAAPGSAGVPLDVATRRWLVRVARTTVRRALDGEGLVLPDPIEVPSGAARPGAAFVTLRRNQRLLGCIGSMEPRRTLADDVAAHAYDAAFRDPRLPSVTLDDWVEMTTEVSVLGPLEAVDAGCVDEVRVALRAGSDGVLLTSRAGHGTFLPSVWRQVPDADQFLELLWRKAGLRPGVWPEDLVVHRYAVEEFVDADDH